MVTKKPKKPQIGGLARTKSTRSSVSKSEAKRFAKELHASGVGQTEPTAKPKHRFNAYLPRDLHERLIMFAAVQRRSMSDVMEVALQEYLDRME